MSKSCCEPHYHGQHSDQTASPRYSRALWMALWINAGMFGVEIVGGISSGSVSLLADAADFMGDAVNYALSLAVLGMAMIWRSRVALFKGFCMGVYGVFVLGRVVVGFSAGALPEPLTMGVIGLLAVIANLSVAWMLYAFRDGDANMRSVWLCTRNDAIGNIAVMLAAAGVFGTHAAWPDLAVGTVMAMLALQAAVIIIKQAKREMSGEVVHV